MLQKLGRIIANKCMIFTCDVQEKFMNFFENGESIVEVGQMMAQIATIYKIPFLMSEQNPRVFGATSKEILKLAPKENSTRFPKTEFTMLTKEGRIFLQKFPLRKSVILYGAEAHICVQQTSLDLLERGYDVHVLTDGTFSRRDFDRKIALIRMSKAGVFLTTAESFIYEILRDYKSPAFPKVLKVVKMERKGIS